MGPTRPSCAVAADRLAVLLLGEPAAVMHQEALGTGEFVGLLGHDSYGQVLAGQARQVGAGQLEALRGVRLVHVDDSGLVLVSTCLQLLERVLRKIVGLVAAWRIVIGGHLCAPPLQDVFARWSTFRRSSLCPPSEVTEVSRVAPHVPACWQRCSESIRVSCSTTGAGRG